MYVFLGYRNRKCTYSIVNIQYCSVFFSDTLQAAEVGEVLCP